MKKLCMVLLLVIAIGKSFCQNIPTIITDDNKKFIFNYWFFQKDMSMKIEFYNQKQLLILDKVDSLLTVIKNDLKYLSDTLKEDDIVRSLDYNFGLGDNYINMTNHYSSSSKYKIYKNELVKYKTTNDTLIITLNQYAFTNSSEVISYDLKKSKFIVPYPLTISIAMNNLLDVQNINLSNVKYCFNDLKKILDEKEKNGKKFKRYKSYTLEGLDSNNEVHCFYNSQYSYEHKEIIPTIGFGAQQANGTFLTSFNFGARLVKYKKNSTHFYNLTFDNLFDFRKINNQQQSDRYTFLTFKYFERGNSKEAETKGFQTQGSLGIGFLINRTGEIFNANTFKMSFPNLTNGWLSLEPEIFFNDFFKNTTLSLKLSINYE